MIKEILIKIFSLTNFNPLFLRAFSTNFDSFKKVEKLNEDGQMYVKSLMFY